MKYHVYVLQKFNGTKIVHMVVESEDFMYETINRWNIVIDHETFEVAAHIEKD